jgi:hypothetical protein
MIDQNNKIISTKMSKVNLPMDVAREISKYNDQTSVIEKLKAELADQKAKTNKYAEYLFTILDEEEHPDTIRGVMHCDVCACTVYCEDLVLCIGNNCGKDIDPEVGRKLKLCEYCAEEYLNTSPIFTEGDGYFEDDMNGEGPFLMCSDCHSGETKIPRIHRLTDAYYKLKQTGYSLSGDLPANTIKIGESDIN